MGDLLKQPDGTYIWEPIFGLEYLLGYPSGQPNEPKVIRAKYFNKKRGNYTFFTNENGKVLKYTSQTNKVFWFTFDAGDDEPSFPSFNASFDSELPDGPEKEKALKFLHETKKLEEKL